MKTSREKATAIGNILHDAANAVAKNSKESVILKEIRGILNEKGGGCEWGKREWDYMFPLAAKAGLPKVLEVLIDSGANVDWSEEFSHSALSEACDSDKGDTVSCVELLLKRGANPNGISMGYPILNRCVLSNSASKKLKLLLEAGADANKIFRGDSLIHEVVSYSDASSLKEIIAHGAKVSELENKTPLLIMALQKCSIEMVEILLNENADIHNMNGYRGINNKPVASKNMHEYLYDPDFEMKRKNRDPKITGALADAFVMREAETCPVKAADYAKIHIEKLGKEMCPMSFSLIEAIDLRAAAFKKSEKSQMRKKI